MLFLALAAGDGTTPQHFTLPATSDFLKRQGRGLARTSSSSPTADEEDGFQFWPPRVVSCSAVRLHSSPKLLSLLVSPVGKHFCSSWCLQPWTDSSSFTLMVGLEVLSYRNISGTVFLWQIVWVDVLEGNQPHKCWMRSFVWHLLTSNKSTNQQLTINTDNSVLRDSCVNNPTFQQCSHEFTLSLFRLIATDPLWWFFCVHGVQKHTHTKKAACLQNMTKLLKWNRSAFTYIVAGCFR